MAKKSTTIKKNRRTSRSSKRQAKANVQKLQSLLGAKVFTIVLLFAIIVVGVSLTKSFIRKVEVQQQIDSLEAEIAQLEQQSGELNDLMSYLGSSSFQEKEARKKLGLKDDGEQVVVIQRDDQGIPDTFTEVPEEPPVQLSNVKKWQNYFFN